MQLMCNVYVWGGAGTAPYDIAQHNDSQAHASTLRVPSAILNCTITYAARNCTSHSLRHIQTAVWYDVTSFQVGAKCKVTGSHLHRLYCAN